VDCLRFEPRALRQALCRATRRRTERNGDILRDEDLEDRVDQRRLADPGAAGITSTLEWSAVRSAWLWLSASTNLVRAATQAIALPASIDGQGGRPPASALSLPAISRSAW